MEDLKILATAHGGLFSTKQARVLGYQDAALSKLVRTRALDHLCRGIYGLPEDGLSQEQRHLRLARGGLLLYPDAALSHLSAVLAHGLPVIAPTLQRVTLVRPQKQEVLTQSFRIRRARHETVDTDTGAAVVPAQAVVHFTLDAGMVAGVVAADRALHTRLVDQATLQEVAATVAGWPRSGRVSAMLAMVDGRSESVGESRLRIHLRAAGIPVVPQVNILDRDGGFEARVDFLVEGTNVIVEFDGKVKYTDGGSDALFAEKRREDELRRLGYTVIRVIWADLDNLKHVIARIRQATAAAPEKPRLAGTSLVR